MLKWPKVNTRLLPMKAVMFGWFGASACALPFMSVHMKELGLTVKETAVIYTLLPITQTLSSPIAGLIADRLGKYRDVLLVSIFMSILLTTALLYVPTIPDSESNSDFKFTVLNLCGDNYTLAQRCGIKSIAGNTSSTVLNSCRLKCDEKYFNVTELVISLTHVTNSTNLCHYKITDSEEHDSSLKQMCDTGSLTPMFNCSITCQNSNITSFALPTTSSGRYLTFYLYSVLRVVHNIFSAIGYTLVNSSALALTETCTELGEYGRQRFWAILSMAIFAPLAGLLVDLLSIGESINYAPAFHTHNILQLLTAIAVWYLDFEMEDAPKSYLETFKNFWLLVRNPTIFFLLLIIFWLGTVWGFMESFLFWFLLELNSPTYLLGLTVTIGSIVGLPFLHYARIIISKVGHANVLAIAVLMYMIRCVGASFLYDAWWIMPFETLEIFTHHLMWVAAATYAAHLSPPGLLATIQGFIEGVHFGVGQGSGSLLGGVLMSEFGSRRAFQVMGLISGAVGIFYLSLHYFWLRKRDMEVPTRRASVKSFHSKSERKNSTLSSEANGMPQPSMELTSISEAAKVNYIEKSCIFHSYCPTYVTARTQKANATFFNRLKSAQNHLTLDIHSSVFQR